MFTQRPIMITLGGLGLALAIIVLGFRPAANAMLAEAAFRQSRSPLVAVDRGQTEAVSAQPGGTSVER